MIGTKHEESSSNFLSDMQWLVTTFVYDVIKEPHQFCVIWLADDDVYAQWHVFLI